MKKTYTDHMKTLDAKMDRVIELLEEKKVIEYQDPLRKKLMPGKWYIFKDKSIVKIISAEDNQTFFVGYGAHQGVGWHNGTWQIKDDDYWQEASNWNVHNMFMDQAAKMGYLGEISIKSWIPGDNSTVKAVGSFEYYPKGGSIPGAPGTFSAETVAIGSTAIFQEGQWAEIVKKEKIVYLKSKVVTIKPNEVLIGEENHSIEHIENLIDACNTCNIKKVYFRSLGIDIDIPDLLVLIEESQKL